MRILYLAGAIAMPVLFILGINMMPVKDPTFFSRVFIPFAIFAGPVVGLIAAMIYLWKLQRESVPGTYRTMRRWLGWGLMLVNLLTIYPIYYLIASLIS
ncbi:MAG: hypothetical protein IJD43_01305 [Thermoguttaceae bacterium]|nr:hypothetical protein [Thermoguttaceae bacterium]